ncbi:MAG: hypothetical protein AAF762_14525 [Pseudomonadota bacterium]
MTPDEIAGQIATAARALPPAPPRRLIAIAGPPAVGKSTIAAATARLLAVPLVPMDGFHLDNATLDARGLRARKGAPETFDLAAFADLLGRLAKGGETAAPGFDRAADAVVPAMHQIPGAADTLVIEGNYLLLDEPGWRDLTRNWTLSVFLSSDEATLERRLLKRWRDNGYDAAGAAQKAAHNDLPNARRILANQFPADLEIPS